MFKKGARIVVVSVLLLVALPAFAQETEVRASVNKQKILLGEPLLLKLEIRAPGKDSNEQFHLDSLPHFEFLKKDSIVREMVDGVQVTSQYYRITSFDSGRWVIPPVALTPDKKTEALFVEVVFTSPFDPGQPYHDIQDVHTVPFRLSKKIEQWWYLTALLLIMITVAIYWLTAEKKPRKQEALIKGAYAKAKHQLKELQRSGVAKNRVYARLVEIFRAYLLERTGVNSLHQTSGDLITRIRPLFSDKELYKETGNVLSLCDLVKFAKYDPGDAETGSAFKIIDQSIDHVEAGAKHPVQKPHPETVFSKAQETTKQQ
ncbi:hypothetical protein A8C56_11455 [Niabella ginsenosidivorans]|uniref:Protein BatD n=1 Tax=Niabella ginsenosidivorans TaxID=1176587 RepID=A0A1A9I499_9BACT|nr:hypothetical protein [Niabella ginsenosidivorans]ANH81512.1 hypothetical protein A8C56_11455 [Niabella ginsenosidivorans]